MGAEGQKGGWLVGAKAHKGARRAAGAGRGGGKEAAVDADCRGRNGAADNGEKIRTTSTVMEKEKERVHDDIVAAMAVTATE